MDASRARQIIQSTESIQVMHEGQPVWIDKVLDDKSAEITFMQNKKKEVIPLMQLIENKMS